MTSVVITLQPVGSVFLAMLLLGESPSVLQLTGVGLVLVGVVSVALAQRRGATAVEPAG